MMLADRLPVVVFDVVERRVQSAIQLNIIIDIDALILVLVGVVVLGGRGGDVCDTERICSACLDAVVVLLALAFLLGLVAVLLGAFCL